MKITSTAFEHDGTIPALYTCDGKNVNPPLSISDIPAEAKTLALIVDDPDASTGMWVHWTMWNIPASEGEISEDMVLAGATEGDTDFKESRYGGPCPHEGKHRYFFRAYALDTELSLEEGASRAELDAAMKGHIVAEAELVGRYKRT